MTIKGIPAHQDRKHHLHLRLVILLNGLMMGGVIYSNDRTPLIWSLPVWGIVAFALTALAVVICFGGIASWKRWGAYGYAATLIPLAVFYYLVAGIAGPLMELFVLFVLFRYLSPVWSEMR